MAENLKFLKGTRSGFDQLGQEHKIVESYFYLVTEETDGKISLYLGSKLIAKESSDSDALKKAKEYADGLVNGLDVEPISGEGKVIFSVSQTDGKVSATTGTITSDIVSFSDVEGGHLTGATVDNALKQVSSELKALGTGEGSVQSQIEKAISGISASTIGDKTGSVVTSISQENGVVSASTQTMVKSDDSVLAWTKDGITSSLKLVKVTTGLSANVKEAYKLVGKDGETALTGSETINIYKDQTLLKAQLGHSGATWVDGNFVDGKGEDALLLAYSNAKGGVDVVAIPLGDFLRQNEFKNGLAVSDAGEVSVNLGATADQNKNFIVMEGPEEGKKSLAVRGMDTNKTVTTERIPVAGGPLADLVKKAGINEIKQGDNVQDILMSLLCKELLPTAPERNAARISSSHGKPTATLGSDGETVEAGTKVTFSNVTVAEPSVSTTAQTYSGFEYGYATSLNGPVTTGNPGANEVSNPHIETESYTLTVSGKVEYTATGNASTINGNASNKEYTITVADGKNEVTASISGSKSTGTVDASNKYYVSSNLSKTYETTPEKLKPGKATVAADGGYTVTASTSSSSESFTVTGDRYGFYQVFAGTPGFTVSSENVRALSKTSFNKFTKITGATGNQQIVVAFPAEWGEIKSVTNDNSLNAPVTDTYVKQSDCMVEGANGYKAINYHVYLYQSKTVLGEISHTIVIG